MGEIDLKEKLYTIPLSEALEKDSECPFCALYEMLEDRALEYTLGPSYMEPDSRLQTNEKGFCRSHYQRMYEAGNRLGLALMVSSHFDEILKKYDDICGENLKEKKGFLKKTANKNNSAIGDLKDSCFVCVKVDSDMEKFYDTFLYLWKSDEDFRNKVKNTKGFCIIHFEQLLEKASKKFSEGDFNKMKNELFDLQKSNLSRVKDELSWFIKKFDYRVKDEPWNNSKDSLKRSLIKLAAFDPEPKCE